MKRRMRSRGFFGPAEEGVEAGIGEDGQPGVGDQGMQLDGMQNRTDGVIDVAANDEGRGRDSRSGLAEIVVVVEIGPRMHRQVEGIHRLPVRALVILERLPALLR